MQPNTCTFLADFSQQRSVETPLKSAPRSFFSQQMMKSSLRCFGLNCAFVAALLCFLHIGVAQAQILQHFHVTAGAASATAGSQLLFTDADQFLAESGYVAYMPKITNSLLPTIGYYHGGPTFTSAANDGSAESPAAAGARIGLKIVAVDGPTGGHWSFWETAGNEEYGTVITFSYASGTTNGTNVIILSENKGQPGVDPYGHIHGRAFTADVPGLYTVWTQLVDVSRNGPGGGPLHTPSQLYRYYFQAGTSIDGIAQTNGSTVVTFGTQLSNLARRYSYYLEARSALDADSPWTTVAGPVTGNNRLQTLSESITEPQRFYRLRVTSP